MKRLGALGRGLVLGIAAASASLAALTAVTPATADPWPMLGRDAYRTGNQFLDQGGVPALLAWSRAGGTDVDVRTSIVTGAGPIESQHTVYGTDAGRVVVRRLLTGAPIGPAGGIDVSSAANPFGGGSASVTPVIASDGNRHGQVYAVVNERFGTEGTGTPGLQLVQIDEATGVRSREDITLDLADGYVIESSPLLMRVQGTADQWALFFVAREEAGTVEALFKIAITRADAPDSTIGAISSTGDINANPQASPSLVAWKAADGDTADFIAVGTVASLLSFRASDLAPGPAAVGLGENVRTPSAGAELTSLYATTGSSSTVLHRITQVGEAQTLTVSSSEPLDGEAANGIATGDGAIVYVTTSTALHAVREDTMRPSARLAGSFRNTVASSTGAIVAVASDSGAQLVLERETLTPVGTELFTPSPSNESSTVAFGQPAIASRFLQFSSDRGVFVYALRRAVRPTGYWQVASDGGVFTHGDAEFAGSTGNLRLNSPVVGMATTPTDAGYWMVAADGGVFAFGDAAFAGSTGDMRLNSPVVGMAGSPTGLGYLLVAADGGVFAFGDAVFLGSTGDMRLNSPIVGMAMTPTGLGYWLVAADGGVFAFGDAVFFGSTGDLRLNAPVVALAAEPTGKGYWLVARDGGVFAFGRAGFFGSTGNMRLNAPIVGMAASATGNGYVFTATDGGMFTFGDAPFLGAAASLGALNLPVVGVAAKP